MMEIKTEYPLARIIKEGEIVKSVRDLRITIAVTEAMRRQHREMMETATMLGDALIGKVRPVFFDDLDQGAIDGEASE